MEKKGILEIGLGVSVIPPQDERGYWTRLILPNKMKKVFDYFYGKDEQPTYEQASKDLGIAPCNIYQQVKKMKNLGMLKIDRRGIITWTLSDFIS